MNSLNILSSRVIGQAASSTTRNRSHSQSDASPAHLRNDLAKARSYSEQQFHYILPKDDKELGSREPLVSEDSYDGTGEYDEKTSLIHQLQKTGPAPAPNRLFIVAHRLFAAIAETIQAILSTIAAPGIYVAHVFRDDDGYYSPIVPLRKVQRYVGYRNVESQQSKSKKATASHRIKGDSEKTGAGRNGSSRRLRSSSSRSSVASTTSESDGDRESSRPSSVRGLRETKNKSQDKEVAAADNNTPRRSIRIKLHNDESLKRTKNRSQSTDDTQYSMSGNSSTPGAVITAESLKSPISQSASHHRITKYPHAPAPPRPLVPHRQPSYTMRTTGRHVPSRIPQKTLVLDLDETLIHSLAKGGRMSSGHMVEVKLATPVTAAVAPGETITTLGPQHPILYYVHKRPHCDEFLRKVCKWYRLVVFTASVQEYADPVIDWLEQERKFFQARYYRQHCTLRNDAFIKDLSSVEPDLSKVMILDNSPTSYIFHEGEQSRVASGTGILYIINMLFKG